METGKNLYLGKRWFAGQVARAGESGIVAVSYINDSDKTIKGGYFVAMSDRAQGCKNITSGADRVLGVTVVMGVHHEFKPGKNLSVMKILHGSEIVVQMAADSELQIGDAVKIVATGDEAGTISDKGQIDTHFYVTDINGGLAKVMRDEVIGKVATTKAGK